MNEEAGDRGIKFYLDTPDDLIKNLEKHNPYSEDIFLPLTDNERKMIDIMFKEVGIIQDRYLADVGRVIWDNLVSFLKQAKSGCVYE